MVGLEYYCVKPANCQMITRSMQDILNLALRLSCVLLPIRREDGCNTARFVGAEHDATSNRSRFLTKSNLWLRDLSDKFLLE